MTYVANQIQNFCHLANKLSVIKSISLHIFLKQIKNIHQDKTFIQVQP